jgi:hypothetical protein
LVLPSGQVERVGKWRGLVYLGRGAIIGTPPTI